MRAELPVRRHHFRGAGGIGTLTECILTSVNVSDVIEEQE
jgi:hypothetical protein